MEIDGDSSQILWKLSWQLDAQWPSHMTRHPAAADAARHRPKQRWPPTEWVVYPPTQHFDEDFSNKNRMNLMNMEKIWRYVTQKPQIWLETSRLTDKTLRLSLAIKRKIRANCMTLCVLDAFDGVITVIKPGSAHVTINRQGWGLLNEISTWKQRLTMRLFDKCWDATICNDQFQNHYPLVN